MRGPWRGRGQDPGADRQGRQPRVSVKRRKQHQRPPGRAARAAAHRTARAPRRSRRPAAGPGARQQRTSGCASATATAKPTAAINGRSACHRRCRRIAAVRSSAARSARKRRTLSSHPWTTWRMPSSRIARRGRRGAAAAERPRSATPARIRQFRCHAVPHVEYLERFTARAEIQASVGEHAVDVQNQQPILARARCARVSVSISRPARSRSCDVERAAAAVGCRSRCSEVMRCVSMR